MSIFGDIAKTVSAVVGKTGAASPIANIGSMVSPMLQSAMMHQFSQADLLKAMLQKDFGMLSGLIQGLGGHAPAPNIGAGVGAALASVDRIAYVAVLQHALTKASQQQSFNMETAINDLWTSVSNLRGGGAALQASAGGGASPANMAAVQSQMGQMSQAIDTMGTLVLKKMEAQFTIIEALR